MTGIHRRRILLVGLDERVLWQLTRTLALWEERIAYGCALDVEEAFAICEQEPIDLMVLDSPETAAQAARLFRERQAAERCPPGWLVLADEVPGGGFLIPGAPRATVLVEKPLHPKEFPLMVLKVFAETKLPGPAERVASQKQREVGPGQEPVAAEGWPRGRPALFPEERYAEAAASPEGAKAESAAPPALGAAPSPSEGFYEYLAKGFECLKNQDRQGALESWKAALALKPDDRRLKANIARLEGVQKGA